MASKGSIWPQEPVILYRFLRVIFLPLSGPHAASLQVHCRGWGSYINSQRGCILNKIDKNVGRNSYKKEIKISYLYL